MLGLHQGDLLDDIKKGQCPSSFFCCMWKAKLELYKTFGKQVPTRNLYTYSKAFSMSFPLPLLA